MRVYVSSWGGGGGGRHSIIENCVDATIQRVEECTKNKKQRKAISTCGQTVKKQNLVNRNMKKNNCMDTSSDKLGRSIYHENTWKKLRRVTLQRETESILIAVENNTLWSRTGTYTQLNINFIADFFVFTLVVFFFFSHNVSAKFHLGPSSGD